MQLKTIPKKMSSILKLMGGSLKSHRASHSQTCGVGRVLEEGRLEVLLMRRPLQ